jgi:hypothetical protein
MNQDSRFIAIILVVGALGAGGYFFWKSQQPEPLPPVPIPKFTPPPAAPPPPAPPDTAPPAAAAEPVIKHPAPKPDRPPRTPLPALAESDPHVRDALLDLFGKKGVLTFLNVDGFVRRFVSTVDNLGNETASVQQWPVGRTAGRFTVDAAGAISPENAERYAPLLKFALAMDTTRAVGLYARLYPLFQQAYEELGFPGRYFNDRAIEVIDQLLATPDLPAPARVKQVVVTDAAGRTRASNLYQFEDPTLEARSAGQKIMLRIGPANTARVKAKLREIRQQITQGKAAR